MSDYLSKSSDAKKMAKILRRNLTKEERHLWYDFLKSYPVRFNRQYVIANYVVDFFCPRARIAIELDGSQHYQKNNLLLDKKRTSILESYEITVLRYSNLDVNQRFRSVCEDIDNHVKLRLDCLKKIKPSSR